MTSSDQDRRIEDRSIELGAARVEVAPLGPASSKDVAARYLDSAGEELDVERIRADGSTGDARPWASRARLRWIRYAGAGAGGLAAIVAALVLAVAPAAAAPPRSIVHELRILEELVPCERGGRVLSIRERDTGLRLVRDRERPPAYLRRVNPLLAAWRGWELDRRDEEDRGLVRFAAHWPGATIDNYTSAVIRVRVRCDRRETR